MVHGDPQQRSARLAEVTEILKREAPPEDLELLLSLAPILFAGMPARLALDLPGAGGGRPHPAPLPLRGARDAARPPALQGPARDPRLGPQPQRGGGARARRRGGAAARDARSSRRTPPTGPSSSTASRTTCRSPACGSTRRSTPSSRCAASGSGSWRSATCRRRAAGRATASSRSSPSPPGSGVRRVEHEVFSLLKAVFLAVDDFKDMGRACRELVPRLRSRRGDAAELASVRAFLEWLLDDNYIFMGTVSYAVAPDGTASRVDETANGAFTDPTLLPVVFPGVVEHVEAHLHPQPGDDRILDLDFCASASAIYHLEPIEDLTVREWGEDGKLEGPHPPARPLRPRRLRPARRPHPDPQGEGGPPPRALRGHPELPRLARDPGHLQPLPEDRPLLRGRRRPRADHPAHRARGERRRDRGRGPQGRGLRGPLRGLLAAALRLPDRGGAAAGLRRRLRAGGLRHLGGLRAGDAPHLLLRLEPARAPGGPRGGAPAHRAARDRLGGPRGRRPRAGVRGARGPAALPPLRDAGVAQRPLPRGDGAGAGAERPPQARGAREPARGRRRPEDVGDGLRAARARCARSTSPTS